MCLGWGLFMGWRLLLDRWMFLGCCVFLGESMFWDGGTFLGSCVLLGCCIFLGWRMGIVRIGHRRVQGWWLGRQSLRSSIVTICSRWYCRSRRRHSRGRMEGVVRMAVQKLLLKLALCIIELLLLKPLELLGNFEVSLGMLVSSHWPGPTGVIACIYAHGGLNITLAIEQVVNCCLLGGECGQNLVDKRGQQGGKHGVQVRRRGGRSAPHQCRRWHGLGWHRERVHPLALEKEVHVLTNKLTEIIATRFACVVQLGHIQLKRNYSWVGILGAS
mmetsp:Transcript_32728/g.54868  ORF Transcript_32728/g.54868 Transcript_32728/m.54868 type:complete len:273 (-) Transcript_32728:373-1191(-)